MRMSQQKQNLLNAKKYVELYMVADHSIFNKYGSSIKSVKHRLFDIVNYINKVYKSINIYVALIGIEIWDSSDQIEVVSNVDTLLHRFSQWRINNLLPRKHHDNAQFLTDIDFNGTTIGYAPLSTMCELRSVGLSQDSFMAADGVGATIAHEMGHNLGMTHDKPSCTCGANTCIMFPSVSSNVPLKFSGCSIVDLRNFIYDSYPDCLLNAPTSSQILSPAVCGNKFIESEEQCDCGEPQVCYNGKCSNIEETFMTEGCAKQCPEHSICDHELQCQCEPGWAPPNCNVPARASQFILEAFSLWWWPLILWTLALDM
ncbi:zinc metalloproteinase-disintegrin-like crotastatin [Aquarana catesbeiana]|uniref:zinc metalloproteinase-disintegrin-like crotastatin n=1 Tax=Aquarana catesbeiana TaxID=8400 RepID=UPI003CC9665A